jgi:hypothetical protein
MNCRQFERRVQRLLDERCDVNADRELRWHVAACLNCAKTLRDYELIQTHFGGRCQGSASKSVESAGKTAAGEASWLVGRPKLNGWALAVAASLGLLVMGLFGRDVGRAKAHSVPLAHASLAAPSWKAELPSPPEIHWGEVLAAVEAFPRQLNQLGPVYTYAAQVTGVSQLTSSLNATADLLRLPATSPPSRNDGALDWPSSQDTHYDLGRLA